MDYTFTRTQVNQARMNADLMAALGGRIGGISHVPVLGMVIVHVNGELTPQELDAARGAVDTHNPDALTPEQEAALKAAQVLAAADTKAANIPGWATWTHDKAHDWYAANVTTPLVAAATLADSKAVLAKMAQAQLALIDMVLALRNKTWPGLEGSD